MFYGPSIFYSLLSLLIWPIGIIGLIVWLVVHFARRKKRQALHGERRFLQIAFSREDALSQLFFLLFLAFTTITLLAVNRQLGEPFSWRSVIFLVSAVGIWLGYRYKALFMLAISVIGMIGWWVAQGTTWADVYHAKASPVLAGLILLSLIMYVVGHFHERDPKWKRFAVIYIVFALIFMSGVLFFLSSQTGLRSFNELLQGGTILASWQIMLALIAMVTLLAVFFLLGVSKNLIKVPERLAVVLFTVFALVILLLPSRSLYQPSAYGGHLAYSYFSSFQELSGIGVFWAAVFNIGVFLEMLGIILVGYMRKESWHVNMGVVLLFILIFIKYFDWFFTSLDKSVFFIVAGILMFVVGWLMERARKRVIQSMEQAPTVPTPQSHA